MDDKAQVEAVRRELHAALAMHALIMSRTLQDRDGHLSPALLSDEAFQIADAMIAKGGPIR